MTQEDRKLLLRDLSARVPYKVYCDASKWTDDEPRLILEVCPFLVKEVLLTNLAGWMSIEYCRPYLRPISSMTDDERKEYNDIVKNTIDFYNCPKSEEICVFVILTDWLNKHHFDYRGLIERGLALKAPEGMYNLK